MTNKKNIGRAGDFSRAELGGLVSFLAGLLDESIDAIWLAAVDDGFLTPERIHELLRVQNYAARLHETFAPRSEDTV